MDQARSRARVDRVLERRGRVRRGRVHRVRVHRDRVHRVRAYPTRIRLGCSRLMFNPLWIHHRAGPVENADSTVPADRTLLSADNKATGLGTTHQLATRRAERTTRTDPPPRASRTLLLTRIPMAIPMPSLVRDRHRLVQQVSDTWPSSRLRAGTPRKGPPATRRGLAAQKDRALADPMRTEVRDLTRAERHLGERSEDQGGERPLPSL